MIRTMMSTLYVHTVAGAPSVARLYCSSTVYGLAGEITRREYREIEICNKASEHCSLVGKTTNYALEALECVVRVSV